MEIQYCMGLQWIAWTVNQGSVPHQFFLRSLVRCYVEGLLWVLCDEGVELDAMDIDDETALSKAVIEGHDEIVDLLLEKGEQE